ncbi:MAG: hypothetical protein LBD06_01485 [Candidatus Accumulibacter sp.]|nr:hypothetical protein [Accumulibacter sp.]
MRGQKTDELAALSRHSEDRNSRRQKTDKLAALSRRVREGKPSARFFVSWSGRSPQADLSSVLYLLSSASLML